MTNLSKEEFVQLLRRQSNGFLRGGCKYRGLPSNIRGYNKATFTNLESYNAHDLDLNLGTPEVKGDLGNTKRLISHNRPLEGLPVALLEHRNFNRWTALIPNYDEENAGIVASSIANSNASSSPLPLVYSAHHPNTTANDTSQYFSWLMPPS